MAQEAAKPTSGKDGRSHRGPAIADFLFRLGPDLTTGAADDDPSGIATYAQVSEIGRAHV